MDTHCMDSSTFAGSLLPFWILGAPLLWAVFEVFATHPPPSQR
jgi:hypothetical protein